MRVPGVGPQDATWVIIGEAPGYYEMQELTPFVGKSGQLLRDTLDRVGLNPDKGYYTNVYKEYRQGNPTPTTKEIKESIPELVEELQGLENLRAILLVGSTPMKALTGLTAVTKNRGSAKKIRREVLELWPEADEIPMFVTLHPAYVLRNDNHFNGWMQDLAAFQQLVNPPVDDDEVVLVDTEEKFTRMLGDMREAKTGALDIETTVPLDEESAKIVRYWESELVTLSITMDGKTAYVIPYKHPQAPKVSISSFDQRFFRSRFNQIEWIMHNGLFDRLLLREITDGLLDPILKHDTMAMAYLLHEDERKGLEVLSSVYLGEPPYKGIDYKDILNEPLSEIALMNGKDTLRTFRLYRPLADELNENPELSRLYQWLLMPAVNTLIRVTENGVPVDMDRLAELTAAKEAEAQEALDTLRSLTPDPDPEVYPDGWPKDPDKERLFNPRSPQQVAHVLYGLWNLPVLKETDTGNPSTDEDTLTQLTPDLDPETPAGQFVEALLAYRKVSKQVSSYLHSWPKLLKKVKWLPNGAKGTIYSYRLHPKYKPLHVATGRLSSQHPNIQNVPRDKEFRNVFGGVPGYKWIKVDYSQLELRIAAWLAGETEMLNTFEAGEDIHARTARLVLHVEDTSMEYKPGTSARQVGKTLNFGLIYGAGPKTLQRTARMEYNVYLTEREAEELHGRYWRAYPDLKGWHKVMENEIRRSLKSVSPLGRIRWFSDAGSSEFKKWTAAVREGINHPVQSFGSDLLLMGMVRVQEWLDANPDIDARLIAEVHDEIDLLAREDQAEMVAEKVVEILEDTEWLAKFGIHIGFPLVAEAGIGDYWGALEE